MSLTNPMNVFEVHWILSGKGGGERILLPMNSLVALPHVGDELRADGHRFFVVEKIVWCLDEPKAKERGVQRVNIQIKKVK